MKQHDVKIIGTIIWEIGSHVFEVTTETTIRFPPISTLLLLLIKMYCLETVTIEMSLVSCHQCRICVIDDLRLIIFLHVIAPRPVMCSFMLICQCCFAIVKVLLKKVTYLLTWSFVVAYCVCVVTQADAISALCNDADAPLLLRMIYSFFFSCFLFPLSHAPASSPRKQSTCRPRRFEGTNNSSSSGGRDRIRGRTVSLRKKMWILVFWLKLITRVYFRRELYAKLIMLHAVR